LDAIFTQNQQPLDAHYAASKTQKSMSEEKKARMLIVSLASLFALPYIGAYLKYGGNFPADMFVYPATAPLHKASFNVYVFGAIALCFIGAVLLYVYPKLFGFKKVEPHVRPFAEKKGLPSWFWIGGIVWIVSVILLWSKRAIFDADFKILDIFIWWGFSIMIDGIVYARSGGNSLIGRRPKELVGIATASVTGWMIFEYFNFFVNYNWYYPNGDQLPSYEFLVYSMVASTAVFPISFELYGLFNTFKGFSTKYSDGIKISLPKWVGTALMLVCFAGMFLTPFFPNDLFFIVWVAPLIILSVLLGRFGIWTPFTQVKKGDWSPLLLLALSWVAAGFCVECWNYFSGTHIDGVLQTENTLYWAYSVPYVNVLHVFEMPLLGFLGYLPYGVYCGIWWITFSHMLDMPTLFNEKDHRNV